MMTCHNELLFFQDPPQDGLQMCQVPFNDIVPTLSIDMRYLTPS